MIIFDRARENAEAIRRIGERAREEARQAGTCIYFIDKTRSEYIIREYPDGRQERVEGDSKAAHGLVRSAVPGR
jgi:hypothetical protein